MLGRDRSAPAPQGPAVAPTSAPTPAAPGIHSAASLFALQRSGGNRAALAALATRSEPVVRRAWEQSGPTTEKWDGVIGGVRWYRDTDHNGAVTYSFQVEDEGALPNLAVLGSAGDMWPASHWKDDWAYGAQLWRDELAGAALEVAPVGGEGADHAPGPVGDGPVGGEEVPALADAAPLAPVPVVAAAPQAHPVVASGRAPQYAPQGAYAWPVTMTTSAALDVRSWVIQHVVITGDGLTGDFYEAFAVQAGATVSEGDIFQDEPGEDAGEVRAVGRMQHIAYTGGAAPPGMAIGAVDEADDQGYSSTVAPTGWAAGSGARHELHFQWDDSRDPKVIRFDTVPAGGDPEWKARASDLETG